MLCFSPSLVGNGAKNDTAGQSRAVTQRGLYKADMCGRVIQSSGPLRLAIVEGLDVSDSRMANLRPRYNAAPSQELLVIRENHKTGERSLDLLRWVLVPHWCQYPSGGRRPINAKAESV